MKGATSQRAIGEFEGAMEDSGSWINSAERLIQLQVRCRLRKEALQRCSEDPEEKDGEELTSDKGLGNAIGEKFGEVAQEELMSNKGFGNAIGEKFG